MKAIDRAKGDQLQALVDAGIPIEDAAESLELEPEAALLYLTSSTKAVDQNADELFKQYTPRMIEVLATIALDESEHSSVRVSAAKVIVDRGESEGPQIPVDKLSEACRRMKSVIDKQKSAPITISNPSPSTTVVDVKPRNGVGSIGSAIASQE